MYRALSQIIINTIRLCLRFNIKDAVSVFCLIFNHLEYILYGCLMRNTLHSSAVMICYTVTRSCEKRFESAMASESGPLSVKNSTTRDFWNVFVHSRQKGVEIWAFRYGSGRYLMIEKTHEFIKTAVLLVFCFSKIY